MKRAYIKCGNTQPSHCLIIFPPTTLTSDRSDSHNNTLIALIAHTYAAVHLTQNRDADKTTLKKLSRVRTMVDSILGWTSVMWSACSRSALRWLNTALTTLFSTIMSCSTQWLQLHWFSSSTVSTLNYPCSAMWFCCGEPPWRPFGEECRQQELSTHSTQQDRPPGKCLPHYMLHLRLNVWSIHQFSV